VWIHQDAWFHIGRFDNETQTSYEIKKAGNGVYAFILEGAAAIEGQSLEERDGLGLWNTDTVQVKAQAGSRILLMEVPMN
jgi:redox-sensitive bicupin YhaK (pirin superfamily)